MALFWLQQFSLSQSPLEGQWILSQNSCLVPVKYLSDFFHLLLSRFCYINYSYIADSLTAYS